jgi:hypothetical protein
MGVAWRGASTAARPGALFTQARRVPGLLPGFEARSNPISGFLMTKFKTLLIAATLTGFAAVSFAQAPATPATPATPAAASTDSAKPAPKKATHKKAKKASHKKSASKPAAAASAAK